MDWENLFEWRAICCYDVRTYFRINKYRTMEQNGRERGNEEKRSNYERKRRAEFICHWFELVIHSIRNHKLQICFLYKFIYHITWLSSYNYKLIIDLYVYAQFSSMKIWQQLSIRVRKTIQTKWKRSFFHQITVEKLVLLVRDWQIVLGAGKFANNSV